MNEFNDNGMGGRADEADGFEAASLSASVTETGRLTDTWRACRRVAGFAATFREILLTGQSARDLKSGRGGLRLSETGTRQSGSILWIDNPDADKAVTGSVFPFLPEVTLGPRTLFPYVHDAPVGAGANYLGAYAGLVKSDAPVLAAHILADPHDGVRVYVHGEIGETREVVVWSGNERGHGVHVTFAAAPELYVAGMSQVIALPSSLAGRLWIAPDDDNAPVLIGPDDVREHGILEALVELAPGQPHTLFAISPNGAITEVNVDAPDLPAPPTLGPWQAADEPPYAAVGFDDSEWPVIEDISFDNDRIALIPKSDNWYRARVHMSNGDGGDAQLHFAAVPDHSTLWVNGALIGGPSTPRPDPGNNQAVIFDIRLRDGDNVLCVHTVGAGDNTDIRGPVTLTPSGGCYLVDVARWHFRSDPGSDPEARGRLPYDTTDQTGPTFRFQATFHLDAPLDSATPLLARLGGGGVNALRLNGHRLHIGQPVTPGADYYLPEPRLLVGENTLVLDTTEGTTPVKAELLWDENAAALMRVAL